MLEELCPPCRGLILTQDKPDPGECSISGENITASWTNVRYLSISYLFSSPWACFPIPDHVSFS